MSDHTLSAKISAAMEGSGPKGGGITKQKLATWYAHAIRLEDVLNLMRMTEVKLAEYSTGHFKRAEAAEAKLKWHEETQRTYYDVEARAAAAEAEVARLRAKLEKVTQYLRDWQSAIMSGPYGQPAISVRIDGALSCLDGESDDE